MSPLRQLAALVILSLSVSAALAMNRCVTPAGGVIYTDEKCESMGARSDRAVKDGMSVVPLPPVAAPRNAAVAKGKKEQARTRSGWPILATCYDPKDRRAEVTDAEIEESIRNAMALWNAG